MSRPDNLNILRERIRAAEIGSVFVASDFADVTENVKVGVSLSRLEEEGIIMRVMRGVYYKPGYSKLLDEYIAPAPDAVADAIARNYGWSIVPCGDTALNLLGLSTQVPAVWSYVSDGPYKEYSYNGTTIKFKHTANREISRISPKTALVIQAIKTLGKGNIRNDTVEKIISETTPDERKIMLAEAQYATSWIYEFIKTVCRC